MIIMKKSGVLMQSSINSPTQNSKRFNNNTLKEINVFT
jgi:hypothetical protein